MKDNGGVQAVHDLPPIVGEQVVKSAVAGTASSQKPVGSVLVVGGGIAGMQAALDLADQGFLVHLVEAQSAIGGKMAQLDKTFPTNDCAMCTISPKLVEVGRHVNIHVHTNAEILDLAGYAGNFQAKVRKNPRYVDPNTCVACNDCVEVCPVVVPDRYNEGLTQRRAIYKLYPQAVPNAYAIDKAGIAPCRDACPAGQRAQGYIALIREGRWDDALRVIKMDNPFPGICGRICNHRCEDACNRGLLDEAINIRALKRFVTDKVYENERTQVEPVPILHEERVAIIGAGPCGLTAAQDLAMEGYGVTVFEAMPVAGGMLRLGVPEYRLPTDIIEREVQDILDLGVELRLNHQVDNLDDIFAEGYDAVLISVGAHEGIRLPIPGANLEGVLVNTHFLRDVRLGKFEAGEAAIGKRVLVLGGGNVAIDCARSAVRLGSEVHLACLEGLEEMPAHSWEVEAAQQEGVILHTARSFEAILGDENGRVRSMDCRKVESFSFDEQGRLHVEKTPDSNHQIECDTVIFSIGQRAGLAFIPDDAGVGVTNRQTIAVNPNTLAATRAGVFAAGDSVSGTAFVIEAVASGHTAARSIIRYLGGEHLEPPRKPPLPVVRMTSQEIDQRVARGEIHSRPRVPQAELPLSERLGNFQEVEMGYDDASAQSEAARCLACGVCSECMSCVFACGVNAINHEDFAREETIDVGAVILAPGYQAYEAEMSEEYGLGRYPNVVTSLQFERLLSASGPTMGHVQRPSDGGEPKKVAFLQCIGSRDQSHDYCSAVCCMYAAKEAVIAKEHQPEMEAQVFLMDMRAFSKGYWSYFERARERYGVGFTRCRISNLRQDPLTNNLLIQYQDEDGERRVEEFDLVVLSVGMEISPKVRELASKMNVELDEYGFCHTVQFNPVETSRKGIYAVGPFREPKDIPESVVEASSAAASAGASLSEARFSLTVEPEFPPERDVSGEEPRTGVFVCHCGSNIAGYLDVEAVREYAASQPSVVLAENNLYTCSQDSIKHITEQIEEHNLNRVVVASCTPRTHRPLFQDSLRAAGLNPALFEMANIRNQCSWVHSHDRPVATQKARELVGMAVAHAALLIQQTSIDAPVTQQALVVGGGAAGMTTALNLAEHGYHVHLVEKQPSLGGNLLHTKTSWPMVGNPTVRDPQRLVAELVDQVSSNRLIHLFLASQVTGTSGFKGSFTSKIRGPNGATTEVSHGVTILATGGQEYRGPEYGYGASPRILTQQELESKMDQAASWNSVVFVLCVGPAEKYCSRICCSVALKNALALKKANPQMQVIILHQDIRAYGFKERLYTEARRQGVLFVRYTPEKKPEVIIEGDTVRVLAWDPALKRPLELRPDVLALSMPVVPHEDSHQVAGMFKVSLDADGFFQEAHVKLRPVDFASEGLFLAGMAHYPKLVDETMIQAQAAAGRAARILSQETMPSGGRVAVVDPALCTGCLTCVRICPFQVPRMNRELVGAGGVQGAAYIETSVCQGCGTCASECPAQAIHLINFTNEQMTARVNVLMATRDPGLISVDLPVIGD